MAAGPVRILSRALSATAGVLAMTLAAEAGIEEAFLPPLVRVPPITAPPVIDGVMSPGEWDGAFMGSGVALQGKTLDPIQVRYWFGYDAKNVYLAAQMETAPGENYAVPTRRLGAGGPAGHFEMLIDPNPCNPDTNWVQAMLYPLGRYENVGYSQRIGGFVPYDVEWNYKDSWKDGWWTVELSAPAEALNRAVIADGRSWGVLLAGLFDHRIWYFSALGEPFAQRSRYQKMIFDKDAPVIQVRGFGDPASGQVTPEMMVRNPGAGPLILQAEFVVRDKLDATTAAVLGQSGPQAATLAPGAVHTFTWAVPTPTADKPLFLCTTVTTAAGKVLYDGLCKIGQPRQPKWAPVEDAPAEPVVFEAYLYPYFNQVRALADFGGVAEPGKVAKASFRMMAEGAAEVLASATVTQFENRCAEALLKPTNPLADGRYTIAVELVDAAGAKLASKSDTVVRAKQPFEHNTLGVSDAVLPPWTPVRVDAAARSVKVWNRSCTLNAAGLPEKMETAGRQILAGPVALVETVNGKSAALAGDGLRFTRTADHAFTAAATARGQRAKADIQLLGEYDGMLKYTIAISGEPGAQLDALDLVMPLSAEFAQFLHAAGDGCRSNYSHALPAGEGTVWDSRAVMNWVMPVQWLTYLWLGDHERGLCWWADSAEGWTLPKDKKTPVVEITRRNGVVTAVFHLLSRPAPVLWQNATPRKIEFAFAATPLKPQPAWTRDIGLCNPAITRQKGPLLAWFGSCAWALSGTDRYQKHPYTFAHLRPIDADCEAWLKKRMDDAHSQGRFGLAYTDMRSRSLVGEPEKAFVWEWAPSRADIRKATIEKAPPSYGCAVSSIPSRVDYDLWCLNRNMDLGMDFWYFDEIQNEGQINPATGLGYRDEDGRWLPTMRLFAYRQLWKRLYTLMHERGQQEPVIVMHNTSTTYAGPMAFCTTTWDFEEANNDPEARQLTKFGMDYLITEAMGHQYGFAASTLGPGGKFEGWLDRHPEEKASADRHWMGVHMVLDMNPYLTGARAVEAGLKTLGEFGWNQPDCRWIPFWEAAKQGLFTISPSDRVYASMYRRGTRALLIVLNDTNRDVTVNWQPSAKLGVRGSLADAETPDTAIAPTGTGYPLALPHFNYRAFLFETGGAE